MTEPTAPSLVERLWQDLLEKDDRTSPAEYPDMALITFDEFKAAINEALTAAPGAKVTCCGERYSFPGCICPACPDKEPTKSLVERLHQCANDPMWDAHAEVPKKLLLEAIEALTAAPAPEDAELVKKARKISPTLAEHWPLAAKTLDRLADRLSRPAPPTEALELAREAESMARFYQERPAVDAEKRSPQMMEISVRECRDISLLLMKLAIALLARPTAASEVAQQTTDSKLLELLRLSAARLKAMSPEQQEAELRAQRDSWVRGEMGLGSDADEAAFRLSRKESTNG